MLSARVVAHAVTSEIGTGVQWPKRRRAARLRFRTRIAMLSGTTKTSGPQSVAAIPRAMSSQRTQTTTHNSTASAATPTRVTAPKRTLAIRPTSISSVRRSYHHPGFAQKRRPAQRFGVVAGPEFAELLKRKQLQLGSQISKRWHRSFLSWLSWLRSEKSRPKRTGCWQFSTTTKIRTRRCVSRQHRDAGHLNYTRGRTRLFAAVSDCGRAGAAGLPGAIGSEVLGWSAPHALRMCFR